MKTKFALAILLFGGWSAIANHTLSPALVERIADAIYIVEGGTQAKVPYGILSVKVESENHARQVCVNTIRNNHARWRETGGKGDFLNFLANKYCPPSDSSGNANWKRNIRKILGRSASALSGSKRR